MTVDCLHLLELADTEGGVADQECATCVAMGSTWHHLRRCQTCGHVGCCDQSPNRHATAHFRATRHPVVRSQQPGETWLWCYVDAVEYDPRLADWEDGADLG